MSKSSLGEQARKVVLAGVGAAALALEKIDKQVEELVQKGEVTVEHGKALNEELKREVKTHVQAVKEQLSKDHSDDAPLEHHRCACQDKKGQECCEEQQVDQTAEKLDL